MSKDSFPFKERNLRILSVDGGGIYGLVSAIWLRKLCEQEEHFLTGKDIDVFSGISAGALMVLLMAKEERPRDFVLRGGLEQFWDEPSGVFSNEVDPVKSWWSWWGIGGWFGEADFLQQLDRHFGDMTLGDLKQDVVIGTFNWVGSPAPAGSNNNAWPLNPWGTQSATAPWPSWASASTNSNWRPRIFTRSHDKEIKVKDVAYAAATPAGFRAVRGGLSDAGIFAVSPSVHALSAILYAQQRNKETLEDIFNGIMDNLKRIQDLSTQFPLSDRGSDSDARKVSFGIGEQSETARQSMMKKLLPVVGSLQNISMLSVGNGSRTPAFWLRDFDLSSFQMSLVPTNPLSGNFYPPNASLVLDGLSGDATAICELVLDKRFHRLNAQLLSIPLLMATALCRFKQWKQYFVQQIQYLTSQAVSKNAVDSAAVFLRGIEWSGEWQPRSAPRAPMEETLVQGLYALANMKRYEERKWAIGINGDTLEPDFYFKYFRERQLPFKSYFIKYGNALRYNHDAYEKNIRMLHNALSEELKKELQNCTDITEKLLSLQNRKAPVGFDPEKGPDEVAEFFVLRNMKVAVDPMPKNTVAHETNLKQLKDYIQRLENYRMELERILK